MIFASRVFWPGGRHGNSLQYSCLENPYGESCLVGYSPSSQKESNIAQPSTGPSSRDDAVPVIERVHPLGGLMNNLVSHNRLLQSRDSKKRQIMAKSLLAFNPYGEELSWKVINETV